jgi:hypothetical protein
MSSDFICLFWLRYESYACSGLLNLLIHSMLLLAYDYMLVILLWSLCEDSLLFCKSWHDDGHNMQSRHPSTVKIDAFGLPEILGIGKLFHSLLDSMFR